MKKVRPNASIAGAITNTAQRLALAKKYYSGELDALRKIRYQHGDTPWRIIRYQRIIDPESLTYPISNFAFTRPKTLAKHLRYLIKECRITPLPTLVEAIRRNEPIPEKTVAITVDGGWVDLFVHAFPTFREFQVPFTALLPTAFVGTNDFFWQDKALFALLWLKKFDAEIEPFPFFPEEIQDAIRSSFVDGKLSVPAIALTINALELAEPADRIRALTVLMEVMKQKQLDFPPDPSFISWQEAEMMEKLGVTFGHLGHTHAYFPELTREQSHTEIRTANAALRSHIREPLPYFAFPAGRFDKNAVANLEESDIKVCLGADLTPTSPPSEDTPLLLRRISMHEGLGESIESFVVHLWDLQNITLDEQSS